MERYFYEEDLGMEVAIEVIIKNLREMLRFSSEMVRLNILCVYWCAGLRKTYFQDHLSILAELGCYSGAVLSAVIAWRLFTMRSLTFINKMYLLYFTIDAAFGFLEAFYLFKLKRER